jgi:hypothetical protein
VLHTCLIMAEFKHWHVQRGGAADVTSVVLQIMRVESIVPLFLASNAKAALPLRSDPTRAEQNDCRERRRRAWQMGHIGRGWKKGADCFQMCVLLTRVQVFVCGPPKERWMGASWFPYKSKFQ